MAGFAYGFDDGGTVDDPEGAGAIPVDDAADAAPQEAAPEQAADNSGALPVDDSAPAPQQQQEPPSRSGLRAPHEALRDTGKAILSYLMGADAAPPEAQKKFVAGVQAEHPNLSPDDANVVAVHKAYELGGPEAAWQMVQFNRMAYDAKQSFAFAALRGTQGKPPDVQAAAQAATQASQHVLDGSSARFNATPDGFVTATVRGPTGQQSSFQMSPTDFARYLNVGADGQWDKVMESGGVPGTLQKIAGGNKGQTQPGAPKASSTADTYEDDDTDTGDMTPIVRKGTKDGSNFGKTPSTLDLSNGETETFTPRDDLEARATRLFPSASQGAQRRQYIAAQMDQAAQGRRRVREAEVQGANRLAVARETGASRVQSADARAQGTVGAAQTRADASRYGADKRAEVADRGLQQRAAELQQRIQQMQVTHGDRVNRQRLDAASRRLNSVNAAIAKGGPEDVQNAMSEMKQLEAELSSPQQPSAAAPQPNRNAPAAASPGQPPEKGAKFYNGKWYRRAPDGSAQLIQ